MKKKTVERIHRFIDDRDWKQFHTPSNLAKSISIEANELLECFQWSDTDYDIEHVKEELADVLVYCQNMLDVLGLDEDEIINTKMDQNEMKYPIEKAKGSSTKYDQFDNVPDVEEMGQDDTGECELHEYDHSLEELSFLNQIKRLDQYQLLPNEYNMALMMLYYYKDAPSYYALLNLDRLLDNKTGIDAETTQEIFNSYKRMKRHFTSSLNDERMMAGTNDTVVVASQTKEDSAANVLMMFHDSEEGLVRFVFGFSPNLGNVRRVDCMEVASNPSSGYRKFLADWRIALQKNIQMRTIDRY